MWDWTAKRFLGWKFNTVIRLHLVGWKIFSYENLSQVRNQLGRYKVREDPRPGLCDDQ